MRAQGQAPLAQVLGPQLPDAQGRGSGEAAAPAWNAESCFSSFREPHFGHDSGLLVIESARCSNTLPHFLHLYSYKGMSAP